MNFAISLLILNVLLSPTHSTPTPNLKGHIYTEPTCGAHPSNPSCVTSTEFPKSALPNLNGKNPNQSLATHLSETSNSTFKPFHQVQNSYRLKLQDPPTPKEVIFRIDTKTTINYQKVLDHFTATPSRAIPNEFLTSKKYKIILFVLYFCENSLMLRSGTFNDPLLKLWFENIESLS
jgi:hypothetical protein